MPYKERPVAIKSRDYWFKVVENLQQNWALIETTDGAAACTVFFIGDTSGVFDRMVFDSLPHAERALRRNGFSRFDENRSAKGFLAIPGPPFHEATHPNGPIYSSGRFWKRENDDPRMPTGSPAAPKHSQGSASLPLPRGRLVALPPLDSDELAAARKRELDIPRPVAAALGHSAAEASRVGHYISDSGNRVDWSTWVRAARGAKQSIAPDSRLPDTDPTRFPETRVQVSNETTLQASQRLVSRGYRPVALNFANGLHPGGGFLNGARAQEEVLCRSTALYETLLGDPMYEAHGRRRRPDSTAWAIYSPDVPVFREDNGTTLEEPWLLSFITCAAPYAPTVGQPESSELLRQRIHRVLAVAQAYGHAALVLGAWGCGAFGNNPRQTAADFKAALDDDFAGAFAEVVFAITDWSPERRMLGPFREIFCS